MSIIWVEAQTLTLQTNISSALQETSGLLYLNGRLITHTDSGGEPALYELDTLTGIQTRKVIVQNATNIDWEDITKDNNFIYIGDFGNNQGNRTNLRIYKISIQDYLTSDTVLADTIFYNYADQIDFTPTNFSTNYDAEALISYGNSLYVFTKNWGNLKTYIYPIPKTPGTYNANKIDSINTQGYITGAVCDSAAQQLLLIGYTFNTSFFVKINNWSGNQFSLGQISRKIVQPNSSIQIEGVAQIDSVRYYISSEKFQTQVSELHILDTRFPLSLMEQEYEQIVLYPNPAKNKINIDAQRDISLSIYTSLGQQILSSNNKTVDISSLRSGMYTVSISHNNKTSYYSLMVQ